MKLFKFPKIYWQNAGAEPSAPAEVPESLQGDINEVATPCPGPCDAVMPIVYFNQPITVPYDSIRESMSLLERAAIDEEESVRRTFTRPDTDPPLSIAYKNAAGVKVKGLGHAGVFIVNGRSGEVSYYEYGRYGGNFGRVRKGRGFEASKKIEFDTLGNPETSSFSSILNSLTKTNGGPYGFDAVYVKLPNGSYDKMKSFAETRMKLVAQGQAGGAKPYDVKGNHCFTFALEVAHSGGINSNVSQAKDLEIILVTAIGTEMKTPKGNAIELPSRQVRVLQERYQPLKVNASGDIINNFQFPKGLMTR